MHPLRFKAEVLGHRLAALAGDQAHVAQAPLVLIWLADLARLEAVAQSVGLTRDGLDYLEMLLVGVIDASLAEIFR